MYKLLSIRSILTALGLCGVAHAELQSVTLLPERLPNHAEAAIFSTSQQADMKNKAIHFQKDVQLRQSGLVLKAQELTYDPDVGRVSSSGKVRLIRDGSVLTGDNFTFDLNKQEGNIDNVSFSVLNAGVGHAKRMNILSKERAELEDAEYSACPCDNRAWYAQAERLYIDRGSNRARAYNTILYIGGLPVLWSPYLAFLLRNVPTSGLLMPVYGMTSRSGIDIRLPYYIHLSPYYDYTITPRLLSKRGLMFQNEFRYVSKHTQGLLNFDYVPRDIKLGKKRWALNYKHYENLGSIGPVKFSTEINFNRVSDDDYYRDFRQNNYEFGSVTYLNQSFAIVAKAYKIWTAKLLLQHYQILQDQSSNSLYGRYSRLPELSLGMQRYNWHGFDVVSDNRLTYFVYPTYEGDKLSWVRYTDGHRAPDGLRVQSYTTVAYPVKRASWYVIPKLGLHLSHYETNWYDSDRYLKAWQAKYPKRAYPIHSQSGLNRQSVSRVLPILSLDSGMVFQRRTTLFGEKSIQTLEPRLFFVSIPYEDQSDIPVYDTYLARFSFASVYRVNRYNGGWDRINSGNILTLGLSSRWYDADTNFERLSVQVAQRYYLEQNRVLLPNEDPSNYARSDILFGIKAALTNTFSLELENQFLSKNLHNVATVASLQWSPKRLASVSLSYRYRRDPLKEAIPSIDQLLGYQYVSLSAQWPLSKKLYGVGRIDYSIREKRLAQSILGLEYKGGCCWTGRVVMQRYSIGQNLNNSSIFLQFELHGLGAVGSSPLDVLKNGVRGYEPITSPKSIQSIYERYE